MKTTIQVGDRVTIECGPQHATHAAREWRVLFDGDEITGNKSIIVAGTPDDIGRRVIGIEHNPPNIEADASFVTYMRRAGWVVLMLGDKAKFTAWLSSLIAEATQTRGEEYAALLKNDADRAIEAWFWAAPETHKEQTNAAIVKHRSAPSALRAAPTGES